MKKVYSSVFGLILALVSLVSYSQPRVVLDSWFNNEHVKDPSGKLIPFHYKWEETGNGGFQFLVMRLKKTARNSARFMMSQLPQTCLRPIFISL